jgi:hypothetical protein
MIDEFKRNIPAYTMSRIKIKLDVKEDKLEEIDRIL